MLRLGFILLLLALAAPAAAFQVDKPLPDPAREARAQALGHEVRCLVCQNQSIADSNAELARDLRRIVRERIAAGDSDAQAVDFLVQRYGSFVQLKPPLRADTLGLWFGPLAVLLLGAAGALAYIRARAPQRAAGLSAAEEAEAAELLKRDGV